MNKTNVKIDGKETVEIKLNGGLFFKKGEGPGDWKLDEDGYLIGADGKYYERWYDDSHMIDNNPIVDLNGEWVEDTVSGDLNIDKNFDYFMSNSNYNVSNGYAQFKVSWSGLTHVDFLYRSYAESSYDYLVINGLDKDKFTSEPSSSTSGILAHTSGSQTTTYKTLSIDCDEGEHFIWFCYRKDSSVDRDSDRAFVGVPNNYKEGEIFEKQGKELFYDYIESSDYIVPRDGYIQYKYYKTYVSPNGHNTFRTSEYILGEEIFVGYNTLQLTYTDGTISMYKIENGRLDYSLLPNVSYIMAITDVNNVVYSLYGATSSKLMSNLKSITLPKVTSIPNAYWSWASFNFISVGEDGEGVPLYISGFGLGGKDTTQITRVQIPKYTAIEGFGFSTNSNYEFTDTYGAYGLPSSIVLLSSYAIPSVLWGSLSSAHTIWSSIHSTYKTSTIFQHDSMFGITSGILGSSYITQATMPNCWFVNQRAFSSCSKMTICSIPKTRWIGMAAFYGCSNLRSIEVSMCNKIQLSAFAGCSRMSYANIRTANIIEMRAFSNCYSLASLTNYWISYIGEGAFYRCSSLKSIDLNNASYIGTSAFYGCWSLSNIYMHKIPDNTLDNGMFSQCHSTLKIHLDPSIYDYMMDTYGNITVYLSGLQRSMSQIFVST